MLINSTCFNCWGDVKLIKDTRTNENSRGVHHAGHARIRASSSEERIARFVPLYPRLFLPFGGFFQG